MKVIKKVFKLGGSKAITLPLSWVGENSYLEVIVRDGKTLILRKVKIL